jgi:hypothetical protein
MKKETSTKHIAGGSPSSGGPKGKSKQKDDSLKTAETLKKESVGKSEKGNMTGKKGYNETPPDVPVKSSKKG